MNLYVFCRNNGLLHVDYLGNIEVKVMSRKENGAWRRMIDKGNRYRDIEVKRPADIIIYWQRFINIYGRFRPYPPVITDCGKTVTIQTEIALDKTLVASPNSGVVYRFAPHTSRGGHLIDNPSSTSDRSPFVLLPIKLHEYAHARVFLDNVVPLFKTNLNNRFGDVIPEGSESEVKALLDEARSECVDLEVELTTAEELRGFQQLNMIGVLVGGEYHFKSGE